MAVFVSFNPLPSKRAGYAELHVEGWNGGAQDVELSIRRNSSPAHLDAMGKWSGEQQWLRFGDGQAREPAGHRGRPGDRRRPARGQAQRILPHRGAQARGELRQYPVRPIPNDVTPSTAAGEAPVQATVVDIAPKSPEPVSPPAESRSHRQWSRRRPSRRPNPKLHDAQT